MQGEGRAPEGITRHKMFRRLHPKLWGIALERRQCRDNSEVEGECPQTSQDCDSPRSELDLHPPYHSILTSMYLIIDLNITIGGQMVPNFRALQLQSAWKYLARVNHA